MAPSISKPSTSVDPSGRLTGAIPLMAPLDPAPLAILDLSQLDAQVTLGTNVEGGLSMLDPETIRSCSRTNWKRASLDI